MAGRPRAVVTGLGVKTPCGTDPDQMWTLLLAGRSVARRVTGFDPSGLPVDFGCEVPPFDLDCYLTAKEDRRADRATRLGVSAAQDAVVDAEGFDAAPERRAVVVGTTGGPGPAAARRAGGPPAPATLPNAAAAALAIRHDVRGASLCVATVGASGGHAVGEALRLVREGAADVVLAGGTDAPLGPAALRAYHDLGVLSGRTGDPGRASRPFDATRDGFVLGEGAAFVVVESAEHAARRGARVYAELAGFGRTTDAYHATAPEPDGEGVARAVAAALHDARLTTRDVVHVSAHACSTPAGDLAEARALAAVFGPGGVPVSAPKGVMGHLMGAAGAVEAVLAVLAVRDGLAPPTANLVDLDPRCEIDAVTAVPRKTGDGAVVTVSSGFGGHNAALVLHPAP
jgi:3-oxoacyl-[acyl-carrier-protein] synthase II